VALGIAVVGVRGAVVGARLLILPARIATRTLLPRRTVRRLAREGSASRIRVRDHEATLAAVAHARRVIRKQT